MKKMGVGLTSENSMCSYLGIGDLTGLPAHDLVTGGLPVSVVRRLTKSLRLIDERCIYKVLGITERAMQRRAASRGRKLNPHVSDRALRLVSVMGLAIEVLGSQDEAERWLATGGSDHM